MNVYNFRNMLAQIHSSTPNLQIVFGRAKWVNPLLLTPAIIQNTPIKLGDMYWLEYANNVRCDINRKELILDLLSPQQHSNIKTIGDLFNDINSAVQSNTTQNCENICDIVAKYNAGAGVTTYRIVEYISFTGQSPCLLLLMI